MQCIRHCTYPIGDIALSRTYIKGVGGKIQVWGERDDNPTNNFDKFWGPTYISRVLYPVYLYSI